jgi:hypothetical protein
MRRILLITTALFLCGAVSGEADAATSRAAQAPHRDITFHDTTLPNGRHRSLAVANATANSCYASTGTSREHDPTQAFKDCMKAQGFLWLSTKEVGGTPARQVASRLPSGSFTDRDTGAVCHNTGWATICDGGSAVGGDSPSATDSAGVDLTDEQNAMDAANASYAQDAATAAANVAAAASFDAQMTVGN